jgi:hypothetical protein
MSPEPTFTVELTRFFELAYISAACGTEAVNDLEQAEQMARRGKPDIADRASEEAVVGEALSARFLALYHGHGPVPTLVPAQVATWCWACKCGIEEGEPCYDFPGVWVQCHGCGRVRRSRVA